MAESSGIGSGFLAEGGTDAAAEGAALGRDVETAEDRERVRESYTGGRQLVVCGMHRSGTSLVASVLQRAGLDVGERLIGRGPGNWRGHFEDRGFWGLHEDMLAARGCTALTAGADFAPPADAAFDRRARELVEARSGLALWGWKDPRTCLFLDFWHARLPGACYVVLYRHPIEVVLSLLRRADEFAETLDPGLALRAWSVYNTRLLDFIERHAERCFVAQVPALTADLRDFVGRVASAFDVPLRADNVADVFSPSELAAGAEAPALRAIWGSLVPDAMALYRRLEEHAAIRPPRQSKSPAGALVGGLVRDDLAALALQETGAQDAVAHLEARFEARLSEQRREAETRISSLQAERDRLAEAATALRDQLAVSEARHSAAAARRDELSETLTTIERSRTFGLVTAWWWLTGHLRRSGGSKNAD